MLLTGLIITSLLCGLVFTRVQPVLLFIFSVVGLFAVGEVSEQAVMLNFINPAVLTLIGLMLASLALERSALLNWISSKIFRESYWQTMLRLGFSTAISSALLNNTAVVATLMGSVKRNQEHPAEHLLIPLSYFAIIGGTLTLIGTSTNLVINGILTSQGKAPLSFFAFTPISIAVLLICIPVIIWSSKQLTNKTLQQDITDDYFLDAEILSDSKLIGSSVEQNGLRALDGLFLVEIVRGESLISPVKPQTILQAGDKLIFAGDVSQVKQINGLHGVEVFAESMDLLKSNLEEVLVSPESILVGKTIKSSGFRARFDAAVVAINRQGQRISGKIGDQQIQSGDKLVLAVGDDFKNRHNISKNFFLLSGKAVFQTLKPWQNYLAVLGFLAAISVSVAFDFSLLFCVLAYLLVMILTKVLDTNLIKRRFPFELWIILTCALSIASAFENSGLASFISEHAFNFIGDKPVWIGLVSVFAFTVLLTEIITNTAAAAIMLPIGLSLAHAYGANEQSFIMAVVFAASACFISPFGYQTNLMVMNAGGYKMLDFVRVGWKVSLAYSISALFFIQLFFPL